MAEFINTCKLIHVCIHSIVKEQKTDFAKEDLATENAPLDDKFTIIFFDNFIKSISRNSKDFSYASFDKKKEEDGKKISDVLSDYTKMITDDKSFFDITVQIALLFKHCLEKSFLSTGGDMVILEYITEDKKRKFAITLMNHTNISLIENHKFKASKALDMKNMALAAIINITRWEDKEAFLKNPNIIQYISGLRDLSEYYKRDFIGASNVQTSLITTRTIMEALRYYYEEGKHYKPNEWAETREKCSIYFEQNPNEVITKNLLNVIMPEELEQCRFYEINNDKEISASFKPHKSEIKKWKVLIYKKKGISLKVEQTAINKKLVEYVEVEGERYVKINDTDGELKDSFTLFKNEE